MITLGASRQAGRPYASAMSLPAVTPASGMKACIFCGTVHDHLTREHVIPQWARRAFDIKGPVTLDAREEGLNQRRRVAAMQALDITLDDAICEDCNSVWLSRQERAVKPVLAPMPVSARQVTLSPASQKLLATWAVKTVLLLELAFRQMYPASRPAEGYEASQPEFAWLRASSEPPPRSRVWMGCWDCQQTVPVRYAPSSAPLPTPDGSRVEGHFATFTLGYVAFQVFTVDYVAAGRHRRPPGTTTRRHPWRRRSLVSGRRLSRSRRSHGPRRPSALQPGTGSSPGTALFAGGRRWPHRAAVDPIGTVAAWVRKAVICQIRESGRVLPGHRAVPRRVAGGRRCGSPTGGSGRPLAAAACDTGSGGGKSSRNARDGRYRREMMSAMKLPNGRRAREDARPAWRPIPAWRWMLAAAAAVVITAFVVTIVAADHRQPRQARHRPGQRPAGCRPHRAGGGRRRWGGGRAHARLPPPAPPGDRHRSDRP